MKKNKCDECDTELEKTLVISELAKMPLVVWVCPKSECRKDKAKQISKERSVIE